MKTNPRPPDGGEEAAPQHATPDVAQLRERVLAELYPWQRRFLDDRSRFKIALWARQTGKDHTAAAEALLHCLEAPKRTWLIVGAGERQARESLLKVRDWAERLEIEHKAGAGEIKLPNGSRLLALPAKAGTIRGYSASLTLTEFAFFENADELWRALYPSITNPLRGEKLCRIISTPAGQRNKFHTLWQHGMEGGRFKPHFLPVTQAVAEGLPLDLEDLRAGLQDPDAWSQEYLCEFVDSSTVLLPYDLIASCESASEAWLEMPGDWRAAGPLFAGIDFGRERDLTVCVTLEQLGDVLHVREVLVLRQTPIPRQIELLAPRVERALKTSLDATGAGVAVADALVEKFKRHAPENHEHGLLETCKLDQARNCQIYGGLRHAFERRSVRVPPDENLREDLHSLQRVTGVSGALSYRAPRNKDGHSDRACALALGLRASTLPRKSGPGVCVGTRRAR